MKTFSELSLSPLLQTNLSRNKFVEPTPVQAQAIPAALAGRDVVATAQTGTGKTLAFLLPMVETLMKKAATRNIQSLILTPTRELAIQINEALITIAAGTGVRATVAVGGLNETTQLRSIRAGAQILIATPGRLCDFLQRRLVNLSTVEVLVLDEADRMLDMGFLPALKMILNNIPRSRQTLLFSATVEKSVAHLIDSYVKNPVRVAIGAATKPTEQVDLHRYEVEQDRKLGLLMKLLEEERGSFLVFARTKHGTDRLAKKLAGAGVKTGRIHGNRTQNQRNQTLSGFKDGAYRVLVATDVAARGIHVDGIAHVVNYDLPQVPEDFIHRVGRTGRAGARGVSSTFSTRQERSEITKIERALSIRLVLQEISGELPREVKSVGPHVSDHVSGHVSGRVPTPDVRGRSPRGMAKTLVASVGPRGRSRFARSR
jgi:ATP-dependent RNA helicase RhlE